MAAPLPAMRDGSKSLFGNRVLAGENAASIWRPLAATQDAIAVDGPTFRKDTATKLA